MATVINGTDFLVYVNGEAIGGQKTCKLTLGHAGRDTTTKDDSGWKTGAEGLRNWSISSDGLVAFDGTLFEPNEMANLIINRTRVAIRFRTSTSGNSWWYGNAYLMSYDVDAGTEDSVAYSASFDGTGVLTMAAVT
jgi:predicted secreted protein